MSLRKLAAWTYFSPTLQAPLACNQWQHVLQCCSATGQYIQRMLGRLNNLSYVWKFIYAQHQSRRCTVGGHYNPGKVGVLIIRQTHWMPCTSSQLTRRDTLQSTGKQWASFCTHSQLSLCNTTHYIFITTRAVSDHTHPCREYLAEMLSSRTES